MKSKPLIRGGKVGDEKNLAKPGTVELVLFVGSPGSGKSTIYNRYMPEYTHVNNDLMKTKEKCMKATKEALSKGQSVVVDNQNHTREVRARYTAIAKSLGVQMRAFVFKTPKEVCIHNNNQRKINSHHKHFSKAVPKIPIHSYFKQLEEPKVSEGFNEIVEIDFVPDYFSNKQAEEMYFMPM
jgi:bifunctional polynucleotide phosphatase/kinase